MQSSSSAPLDPIAACLSSLDALYLSSSSPEARTQANLFLIAFQNETISWTVGDQILMKPDLQQHHYFYAANILHYKVMKRFSELPNQNNRIAFRDSVINHIKRFHAIAAQQQQQQAQPGFPSSSSSPSFNASPILARLSLVLSLVVIHLTGNGEWPNAIPELVQAFNDLPTATLLLDLLTFIPDETSNWKLLISALSRSRAQREGVLQHTELILKLLMHYLALSSRQQPSAQHPNGTDYIASGILSTPNSGAGAVLLPQVNGQQKEIHGKILSTFLAWVKANHPQRKLFNPPAQIDPNNPNAGASVPVEPLCSDSLINHPLLLFCFKILASRSENLDNIAIEVLGSLVSSFTLESRMLSGGFRGFRSARSKLDEDEEEDYDNHNNNEQEREEGEYDEQDSAEQQYASSKFGIQKIETSQYQHIYFMRFMIEKILALFPLFEALPASSPSASTAANHDDHVASANLCRVYSTLFSDLAESYLDYILEFCLGAEGFSPYYDPASIENLKKSMQQFAAFEARRNGASRWDIRSIQDNEVVDFMSHSASQANNLVAAILKLAAHHRRDVTSNAMHFWFLLSEALRAPVAPVGQNRVQPPRGAQPSPPTLLEIREKKKAHFLPAFQQLIPSLHRLIAFPPNYTPGLPAGSSSPNSLSEEELDEFYRSRKSAAHCLLDIENIVGFEKIFGVLISEQVLGNHYQSFISDASRSSWRPLEATLYCIRMLAKRVRKEMKLARNYIRDKQQSFQQIGVTNTQFIPRIMDLILDPQSGLQACHPLKFTSLNLLAKYSFWVREFSAVSTPEKDYLPKVLFIVVQGLPDHFVLRAAASAFLYICESNGYKLANSRLPNGPCYLDSLMQVYAQICATPIVGKEDSDDASTPHSVCQGLTFSEQKKIIDGVAECVCYYEIADTRQLDLNALSPTGKRSLKWYLYQLFLPMIQEINKIILSAQQNWVALHGSPNPAAPPPIVELSAEHSKSLAANLDRLGECIATLAKSSKYAPDRDYFSQCIHDLYLQGIAPLAYQILSSFCNDERRVDKLGRVIKHVIKCTKLIFIQQCLPPLINAFNQTFLRYPWACLVYLMGVLVDHFGITPQFQQLLVELLPAFFLRALETIPNLERMQQSPEMVEDLFTAAALTLDKSPELFFSMHTCVSPLFAKAVQGLFLPHRESLSALTHFFAHFIYAGIDDEYENEKRGRAPLKAHQEIIQNNLKQMGENIAHNLVQAMAGMLPWERLEMLVAVFGSLLSFAREGSTPWFASALSKVALTADPTREEFLANIMKFERRNLKNEIMKYAAALRIAQEQS